MMLLWIVIEAFVKAGAESITPSPVFCAVLLAMVVLSMLIVTFAPPTWMALPLSAVLLVMRLLTMLILPEATSPPPMDPAVLLLISELMMSALKARTPPPLLPEWLLVTSVSSI